MPATLAPPAGPVAGIAAPRLDNAAKYERFERIPILDCHDHPRKGKVTRRTLDLLARNSNARAARGQLAPIYIGHTSDADDRPETQQPPPVGFARNFVVGTYNDEPCLLADLFIERKYADYALSFPHRSPERMRSDAHDADNWIDSIALLRRPPERPLGILTRYVRSRPPAGAVLVRYHRDFPPLGPAGAAGGVAPGVADMPDPNLDPMMAGPDPNGLPPGMMPPGMMPPGLDAPPPGGPEMGPPPGGGMIDAGTLIAVLESAMKAQNEAQMAAMHMLQQAFLEALERHGHALLEGIDQLFAAKAGGHDEPDGDEGPGPVEPPDDDEDDRYLDDFGDEDEGPAAGPDEDEGEEEPEPDADDEPESDKDEDEDEEPTRERHSAGIPSATNVSMPAEAGDSEDEEDPTMTRHARDTRPAAKAGLTRADRDRLRREQEAITIERYEREKAENEVRQKAQEEKIAHLERYNRQQAREFDLKEYLRKGYKFNLAEAVADVADLDDAGYAKYRKHIERYERDPEGADPIATAPLSKPTPTPAPILTDADIEETERVVRYAREKGIKADTPLERARAAMSAYLRDRQGQAATA